MHASPRNPLDLPEIRQRVCLFLATKDAIACALVCKDWTDDFISALWHTVMDSESSRKLVPAVISKHGQRIRVIKNLSKGGLVDKLQNASVSKLKSFSVTMAATSLWLAHIYDIIQRNINTLESIDLSLPLPVTPDLYFTADAFSPHTHTGATSKLTHLKIRGLRMTRNAFSRLLRTCPSLQHLDISDTVLQSIVFTDVYQHLTLSHLSAPIEQIFCVDASFTKASSLLLHFPNLATLETWQSSTTPSVSVDTIGKEIAQRCPNLNSVRAREGGLQLSNLLVYGTRNLTDIHVLHKHLSPELIMAMLTHKDTLKTVTTHLPSDDIFRSANVPSVNDHLTNSRWSVQILFSTCPPLQTFSFPSHEMHMDDVERFSWTCHDLEKLHVRFKDLNTKELINQALQMWVDGKRTKSGMKDKDTNSKADSKHPANDSMKDVPIDVRVARHLLRFEKLKCVWLGTKIWQA
ncbi:MAG: hypothetical protein J3Q66DRAFT_394348 [Benniella sp.]|nr:MAG: hypothetical protein J3Q66DRAFT_394348 [Benniella sp.]